MRRLENGFHRTDGIGRSPETHCEAPEQIELSVMAPCFNEEENVTPLVTRLLAVFERRKIAGEIVLVNDCSTDTTGPIIDSLAARHPVVVAIHHPENRGLSAAWNTGLAAARGTYVCFIDADLQHPPEEVWRLYREIIQSRADMVQGVRSPIGRLKDDRYLASRVLNVMLNLTFGMSATDNKSGFVIALRETMTDTLERRFRYRYSHVFITVAAHAKGFTLREVETLFQNRNAGVSFISRWPVKLIADICWETAKAFVEFRLLQEPVEPLDHFLRVVRPGRERVRPGAWRRLVLEAYFLGTPFRRPLITRRVRRMYQALMSTQWASPAEIQQLQGLRLRRLMRHVYHHVPYYRELFDRLKIRPDEIRTHGDLRKIPALSKKDVGENLYFDLFADNHKKREMQKVTTGGPDGERLDVYVDRMQLEMRFAAALRGLEWTGMTGVRNAARSVFDRGGREDLSGLAYECEAHDGRHIVAESYIVEILKEDGRAARPGEVGELVVTDLNSFSVPLIRYQTGNVVMAMDDVPCVCGRGLPRVVGVRPTTPNDVRALPTCAVETQQA
jgi:phenylacetate-CoA ligase